MTVIIGAYCGQGIKYDCLASINSLGQYVIPQVIAGIKTIEVFKDSGMVMTTTFPFNLSIWLGWKEDWSWKMAVSYYNLFMWWLQLQLQFQIAIQYRPSQWLFNYGTSKWFFSTWNTTRSHLLLPGKHSNIFKVNSPDLCHTKSSKVSTSSTFHRMSLWHFIGCHCCL